MNEDAPRPGEHRPPGDVPCQAGPLRGGRGAGNPPVLDPGQALAGDWDRSLEDAEWLSCPVRCSPTPFVLQGRGVGMESRCRDGDLVFASLAVPAYSGRFVVVCLDGSSEATPRQIIAEANRCYLQALNPDWPERIVPRRERHGPRRCYFEWRGRQGAYSSGRGPAGGRVFREWRAGPVPRGREVSVWGLCNRRRTEVPTGTLERRRPATTETGPM